MSRNPELDPIQPELDRRPRATGHERRSPTEPDPRDRSGAVPLLQRDLVALSLARCPDKRTA
jgi:hypothetical protein